MIMNWLKHNYNLVGSIVICFVVGFYLYGCDSKTRSVLYPAVMVTRAELRLEADELLAGYELKVKRIDIGIIDLDRQDEIKQRLITFGLSVAETGTFNPIGLATLLGSVLGAGLLVDNRRKDTVIKTLKTNK